MIRRRYSLPILSTRLLPLLLALLVALPTLGQQHTAWWYFGDRAGLDFRSGSPVAVTNGRMYAQLGCTTQADSLGNLLFYSNGETVWNRQHQPMVDGIGLSGNRNNSILLSLPQPGSKTIFYVFTTTLTTAGPTPHRELHYAVVDLGKHGGLGAVVQRNEPLLFGYVTQLVAVPHRNQRDIWLIARDRDTDQFFAYLLTADGLQAAPVISADGYRHDPLFAEGFGQLKASPDGRRLASAAYNAVNYQRGLLELLDFNANTGRITNPVILPSPTNDRMGVEFSPDGTKVYTGEPVPALLYQYDLAAPYVAASMTAVPVPVSTGGRLRGDALQLGPDGRIYVTLQTEGRLGVIPNPNQKAPACGYSEEGVELLGRTSTATLPTFLQRDLWRFAVRGTCQGEATAFDFPTGYGADSVRWDFGDEVSAPQNHSTLPAPTHRYSTPGKYAVTLTLIFGNTYRQTLRQTIEILPRPTVNLGRDTAICPGASVRLNATQAGATYRWQDGSTAPTLTASATGTYWVDVTNSGGCTTRDSLRLTVVPLPRVKLGPDTVVCAGERLLLRPRPVEAGIRYRWSDGSTRETLTVTQPGTYWVEGTNVAGCSQRDSIRVVYLTPPVIYLGPDTAACQQEPFVLGATLPSGVRYRWSDGSTAPTFTPTRSGTYSVTVYTPLCSLSDTIQVRLYDCRERVFVPNIITPNGDGLNDRLQILDLGAAAWELTIYDRWGRQVYRAQPYRHDWDAAGLGAGVYYYHLAEPGGRRLRGQVQVVR